MALCSACHEKYNPTTILEKAASELLPPDVELYDFGGQNFIVPIPHLTGESLFYLGYVAALVEKVRPPFNGNDLKILAFRITNARYAYATGDFSSDIVEDLKRAIAAWPDKACSCAEQPFTKLV